MQSKDKNKMLKSKVVSCCLKMLSNLRILRKKGLSNLICKRQKYWKQFQMKIIYTEMNHPKRWQMKRWLN